MKKPKTKQEKNTKNKLPNRLIQNISNAEAIINAIGDGVSILDRTFTILYENQIHRDLTGDHVGEKCYKAYQKRQGICGGCPVALTFKEGKVHTVQRELQTDKGIRYMEITASPLKDSEGAIIAGIEVVRDITERKQAEESLKASEERFRALTESTSDWIWEVDQYGVYTYASPKVKDLLGYEPNEIIGKMPFDFMPEDEVKRISEIFHSIIESRKPFATLENTNLHKDGRRVILETSGVPVFDKNSNFIGYRGIDRDITKRKQVEEELIKSEIILSSSFKALDGLLVILDKDFRVVMSNWKDHGFVSEEIRQGHPYCYEIFKHMEAPCEYCPPRDTFNDGKFRIYEDKNPVDGSYKEISVSPVLDETSKVIMVIQHVRDITGRKQAEKEIQKKVKELEDFYNIAVNRELRMKELKEQMEEMKIKLEKYENR